MKKMVCLIHKWDSCICTKCGKIRHDYQFVGEEEYTYITQEIISETPNYDWTEVYYEKADVEHIGHRKRYKCSVCGQETTS